MSGRLVVGASLRQRLCEANGHPYRQDGSLYPGGAVLGAIECCQNAKPKVVGAAGPIDDARIPVAVHVGTAIEPSDLRLVSAIVPLSLAWQG
jgi:hypothetical protein